MSETTFHEALRMVAPRDMLAITFGLFDRCAIAENEIAAVGGRRNAPAGSREYRAWDCFGILTTPWNEMTGNAFHWHCRELITRVMDGKPTNVLTDAEMMWVLNDVTQIAPIQANPAALYYRLFKQWGQEFLDCFFAQYPDEQGVRPEWQGGDNDTELVLRKKLQHLVKDRVYVEREPPSTLCLEQLALDL